MLLFVVNLYERHHDPVDGGIRVIGGEADIGGDAAQDMGLHLNRPVGKIARAVVYRIARAFRFNPQVLKRDVAQRPLIRESLARFENRTVEKCKALVDGL